MKHKTHFEEYLDVYVHTLKDVLDLTDFDYMYKHIIQNIFWDL